MFTNIFNTTKIIFQVNMVIVFMAHIYLEMTLLETLILVFLTSIGVVMTIASSLKNRHFTIPNYDVKIYENGKREYNEFPLSKSRLFMFDFMKVFSSIVIANNFHVVNTAIFILVMSVPVFLNRELVHEFYTSYTKPKEMKVLSQEMKDFLIPQKVLQKELVKKFKEYGRKEL